MRHILVGLVMFMVACTPAKPPVLDAPDAAPAVVVDAPKDATPPPAADVPADVKADTPAPPAPADAAPDASK